ncbi:C2H2 transcription factor [Penicillium sp. IBT 18751x]|nr:C2H2 transcription factor [Penicillium sp. IBT 18751x]KAJ6117854.1 C2H2 transcription factor [Penicillium sp. IBT 18751x]
MHMAVSSAGIQSHEAGFAINDIPDTSASNIDASSKPDAVCDGMTMCPQDSVCSTLLSFTSDFLLFDDIEIPLLSVGSTTTNLDGTESWAAEDNIGPLPDSRMSPAGHLRYLRSVATLGRQEKKLYFCRFKGCSRASRNGFSSRRTRDRHYAMHSSRIACEREGCSRLFTHVESMKNHVERVHQHQRPVQDHTRYII